MKNKMKKQILLACLFGVSSFVSSGSLSYAADQELIVTGGSTSDADLIGLAGETLSAVVEDTSIWTGDMEVNLDGSGAAEVTDSSWLGVFRVNDGYGRGAFGNAKWQGNLLINGTEGNRAAGEIILTNGSTWDGEAVLNSEESGSGTDIYLSEGSNWTGNLELENSDAFVSLENSQWKGNVSGKSDVDQRSNVIASLMSDSYWEGNMDGHVVSSGDFGVSAYESSIWRGNYFVSSDGLENTQGTTGYINVGVNSSWLGDATIVNGSSFTSNFYNNSYWKGNLFVDNSQSEFMSAGHVGIDLSQNSAWEGDLTVIGNSVADAYPENLHVDVASNSKWNGNLHVSGGENTIYATQNSINVSDQSGWIGDAVFNGRNNVNINVFFYSTWNGNLDLSQNGTDPDFSVNEGSMVLTAYSMWQGHIIDSTEGVDLNIYDNSTWLMTDDSATHELYLDNDSVISFVSPSTGSGDRFYTLDVLADLNGGSEGAQFNLRTDLAGNQGDLVHIRGDVYGQYLLGINNQGSAWVNPANELTVVKTGNSDSDAFSLAHAVEVGGFEYGLKQVGMDWNLFTTGRASSSASASLNGFAGSYLLNYAETQTLIQRMGDLRQGENQNGVWAKVYGGKFNSSADSFLSGFDMTYSGVQVGGDRQISLKEGKGDLYVGGMFGYGKGNLDYGVGSGSVNSKTLGVYGTYVAPTGFYADMVLKYGWMKNDYKVLDSSGVMIKGDDMNTSGLSASLEIGQRLHLDRKTKEGWYVEPQAQLTMGHQSGGNFTASNGLNINVDSYNSVLGRVGMQAGYEVKSGKNPINVYAKASYVHEFDGDVGIRLNGVGVSQSFGDSWITYGVGATAQIAKKHNLYLDIERASGGKFNQPWAINAGYRFEW